MYVFSREYFVNLLTQAQDIDVHGNFESLALICFVPDQQRHATWLASIDEYLRRAYDDSFCNFGIGKRHALNPGRRSDHQRTTYKQMQHLEF